MLAPRSRLLFILLGITAAWLAVCVSAAVGAPGSEAATIAGSAVGPPPSRTSALRVPGPIAGQGYHLVFRDDFNHFRKRVWTRKIWYDDAPQSNWKGFQRVRNGVLHLRTGRSYAATCTTCSGEWPINTITTLKSRSFQQGYFEARMRWTRGDGAWPGFWLLSTRHARNPAWPNVNPYCANHSLPSALCWSAELDVFEGQGSEPHVFYGTLHRNSSEDYGVQNDQNNNNYHPQRKNLTTHFHVYGARWTGSTITWYLDGKRLMSAPVYASTNQPMFLLLQMWVGGWTKDPDASTPNVIQTKVDWVRVWSQ